MGTFVFVYFNGLGILVVSIFLQDKDDEIPKVKVPTRLLPATFADLPAPKMEWEQMPTAPVPRLDGYSIQIKNLFYVFCGFGNLDHVRVAHLCLFFGTS